MKETFKSIVSFTVLNFVCLNFGSGIRLYETNNTDTYLTSLQIIRKYGYPAEAHVTRTQDGYILEIHRIPHGKNSKSSSPGPTIFLQHGLLGTSADFLLIGPEQALPFLLADKGYDVWLGNIRGNTYSRAHETLTPEDYKFWDFSWHESGLYDISAQIDYICNYTQQNELIYLGYSMGTTEFLVLTSMKPEYQKKIRGAVFLAAVAYLQHTRTPLRIIAPLSNDIQALSVFLTDGEFLQQSYLYRYLVRIACTLNSIEKKICSNILFLYSGCDPYQFDQSKLTRIAYHLPAGSSVKSLAHYGQLVQSVCLNIRNKDKLSWDSLLCKDFLGCTHAGEFQQFDYGPAQNRIRYNNSQPPKYKLEDIHTPLYLFEGANDFLSTEEDVSRLVKRLPNVRDVTVVDYPLFNHIDFVFAKNVKELLYDKVLKVIDSIAKEAQIRTEEKYDDYK